MASRDLYNNITAAASIGAQAVTAALNGSSVDMANYASAVVLLDLGTFAGTTPSATIQIQESDDNSTFTAVAAADLHGGALPGTIDTTNDAQLYERGYIGQKRYLRVAITAIAGTGPSLPLSAVIVRGHPRKAPI
jgi:hypothetical protein